MHDLDLFPDENVPEDWNVANHRRQDALIVEHFDGQIIHLQPVCHVSDALPVAIRVSDQNDFMSERQQALREVVDVLLDPAMVREEKVGRDAANECLDKWRVINNFRFLPNVHSFILLVYVFWATLTLPSLRFGVPPIFRARRNRSKQNHFKSIFSQ